MESSPCVWKWQGDAQSGVKPAANMDKRKCMRRTDEDLGDGSRPGMLQSFVRVRLRRLRVPLKKRANQIHPRIMIMTGEGESFSAPGTKQGYGKVGPSAMCRSDICSTTLCTSPQGGCSIYVFLNELLDFLLVPCADSCWIRVLQPNVIAHRHRAARELYVGHVIGCFPRAHIYSLVSNG